MPTCTLCSQDDGVMAGPLQKDNRADLFGVNCPRCGRYFYDDFRMHHVLTEELKDVRYIISGVLRIKRERGDTTLVELTPEIVNEMLKTAPAPRTAQEYVDGLLLYLATRVDRPWDPITHDKQKDYSLLFMKDPEDMNGFIGFAKEMGYLLYKSGPEWKFTVKGWERVEQLRAALPDSRQAFVAMSFSKDLTDVYDKGLKPGVEDSAYFKALRSDKEEYLGKIDDWIIGQIRRSGVVVADFTENKGGVYYEAGFAAGLGIPVIYTCREDDFESVHFDTNHISHVLWKTPDELREKLNNRIVSTVLPKVERAEATRVAT